VAPFAHSSFATNPNATLPLVHPERFAPLNLLSVISDFDGDRLLDQAELHVAGEHRCIRVRFGNSRENHLELSSKAQAHGSLLARDINCDNKVDLIWLSLARSEPSLVWFGDGVGHFSKPATGGGDALGNGLFGYSIAQALTFAEEQVCLTADPISCEQARSANLDQETLDAPGTAYSYQRFDPEPYLSYLRERGPPTHSSL